MAQILQTIDELELFFADLVSSILSLDQSKALIQYEVQGQPSCKITDDAVYLKITPEPDERAIYKSRNMVYNDTDETFTFSQQSTRTLTLHAVFYGPNCYELCTQMNEAFYMQSSQLLFSQNYLSIVPDRTNGPIRLPEFHNGQWWQRCDIEVRFYNTIQFEETVNSFSSFDIRTEVD